MSNSHCNEKECPMMKLRMPFCCTGSEIDPPCIEMTKDELEELKIEIEENNHDKGE